MKIFKKILCAVLCLSMLVPAFAIMPSAETSETVFIDEDFENTDIGAVPDGWIGGSGTGLTATVESSTVEIEKDVNKALNVSHLTGTAVSAKHDFTRASTVSVSFDYQMQSLTAPISDSRPNGGSNGVSFYCMSDD